MNLRKTIAAAGLAAAAMTGMASADPTIIYFCGSTAYRAPVTSAIINELTGSTKKTVYAAGNQASGKQIFKAQTSVLADGTITYSSGTFTGTATTIVECNWTGSLAGVVDVATQNSTLQYPDVTDSGVESAVDGGAVTITGTSAPYSYSDSALLPTLVAPGNSGANVVTHVPNVAMSDAFSSTAVNFLSGARFNGSVGGTTVLTTLQSEITSAGLVEAGPQGTEPNAGSSPIFGIGTNTGYLGIVPFEWVLGNTGLASAPFKNITQQTANYLIKNGYAPVTMFATTSTDGSTANSGADFTYLIGRNEDSGTRIDAISEPQIGYATSPKQFYLDYTSEPSSDITADLPTPTVSGNPVYIGGSSFTVSAAKLWPGGTGSPLNTEKNLYWSSNGHSGYPAGGDVTSVLSSQVPAAGGISFASGQAGENSGKAYFIGYLGTSDAGGFNIASSVTGGTALTYDGVACSAANIIDGSYSFWAYEHMYYLPSGTTGSVVGTTAGQFVDEVANDIASSYAVYNSAGASDPTGAGAGVLLPSNGTSGSVVRTSEGGGYSSLNY